LTIRIILIFITVILSSGAFGTNIRVLDFQKIIENNTNISKLYDEITKDQESHKEKFKNEELSLQSELERIEKLNLILEPTELEKEIGKYNITLNIFNDKITQFNLHYESQINNLKNTIMNITLELLKKYSDENEIDLVLDSSNYILSSNSINITNIIQDLVNSKQIEINFEKY
jgi:Skp family chaperone for outer membrane proteins